VTRRTTLKAGKHDTVASIAKRYRVKPAQVAEWNNVGASAAFKSGEQVVVYVPVRPAAHGKGGTRTAKAGAHKPGKAVARSSTKGHSKVKLARQP
jgi:membrane-bound lytic murein transglycosylase D